MRVREEIWNNEGAVGVVRNKQGQFAGQVFDQRVEIWRTVQGPSIGLIKRNELGQFR